jgi:hypothetical protein
MDCNPCVSAGWESPRIFAAALTEPVKATASTISIFRKVRLDFKAIFIEAISHNLLKTFHTIVTSKWTTLKCIAKYCGQMRTGRLNFDPARRACDDVNQFSTSGRRNA